MRVLQRQSISGRSCRAVVRGVVISRQERTSAKGKRFAFVQLSDTSGVYEIVVFSELLATARELLEGGQRVLLSVDIRADGDGVRLSASEIRPLDEVLSRTASELTIVVENEQAIDGVREVMDRGEAGNCKLALLIDIGNREEVQVKLPGKIALTGAFRTVLADLPGVAEVIDP